MKEKILEAIAEFNKYHGIEAQLNFVSLKKNLVVQFSGHMCFTCGVNEYVEDFRLLLEDRKIKAKLKKTENKKETIEVNLSLGRTPS